MTKLSAGFRLSIVKAVPASGLSLLLAACSPLGTPDHFTCAATIGAWSYLQPAGKLGDAESQRVLIAAMGHFNAWAIPSGLGERAAFDAVNTERDRIIAAETPEAITVRAQVCMASIPSR